MVIKKSEILLILISTAIALVFAVFLLRWLQPSLLGISDDMVLVKSSEKVSPYYENIFRKKDFLSNEFIIKDPLVKGRARQLFPDLYFVGPNDILGFRNEFVPNDADIIIIGDSQTYGNNSHMRENWPHYFKEAIAKDISVYSMATGGWGALQYYYIALKAPIFTPNFIIIAFYTGNDALETFSLVYASDRWSEFISDPTLTSADVPQVIFPTPEDKEWHVTFSDGYATVFTPELRNVSNKKHPAINAGYQSIIKIAEKTVSHLEKDNINVVFTIIPTKELVYSKKIKNEKITETPEYLELVNNENSRIDELARAFKSIQGAIYIDVINPLQEAALKELSIYPSGTNGHPLAEGYKIIGQTIANKLEKFLNSTVENGLALAVTLNKEKVLIYIDDGKYWFVDVEGKNILYDQNEGVPLIQLRRLSALDYSGHIKSSDIPNLKMNYK